MLVWVLVIAWAVVGAVALRATTGRVVCAALAVWMALAIAYFWVGQRNAEMAEEAHRVVLERAGTSYAAYDDETSAALAPWFVGSAVVAYGAIIWAAYMLGPALVLHALLSDDDRPVDGLIYVSVFVALSWFGRRDQRRRSGTPPGPFKPSSGW